MFKAEVITSDFSLKFRSILAFNFKTTQRFGVGALCPPQIIPAPHHKVLFIPDRYTKLRGESTAQLNTEELNVNFDISHIVPLTRKHLGSQTIEQDLQTRPEHFKHIRIVLAKKSYKTTTQLPHPNLICLALQNALHLHL